MDGAAWICVGRLRRTRGTQGEFLAEIYSRKPGRASRLRGVALQLGERRLETTVQRIWHHGGVPVFKFAGIDSIGQAEPWEGADLLVPPDQRVPLEPGEYSHADLIGCAVATQGGDVGVVTGIGEYGGPVVLEVRGSGGRQVLIPFARDICREIDLQRKRILVEPPEGLLDL